MTSYSLRAPQRGVLATAIPLALALVVAGCPGADDEPNLEPPPEEPAPPVDPAPPPDPDRDPDEDPELPDGVALSATCTNEEYGFQVQYPDGWVVNQPNGLPRCSAFDPDDVSMPTASEIPRDIAIVIYRDRVPYETTTDFDDDIGVRAVSRQDTRVDGHRAVRAELEATGQGLYSAGERHYVYYVEDEPYTVIAMTHDIRAADPPSYQERQRILEQMLGSLRFINAR